MPATALNCKECGADYPLEALFVCDQCFGPLEVTYDFSGRQRGRGEAQDPGRAGQHLALRGLPAVRRPARRRHCSRARPRCCGPTGWPSDSGSVRSGSRTTPPTRPTASRTGSSRSPWRRRSSSASTPSPAPRPATSRTRSRPTPRRRASTSYVFVPGDLEEQKLLATDVYGTELVGVEGNYDDVNRLCTELAAGARAGRSSTSTSAPTTRRARRRSPTRPSSSSAGELPDAVVSPIASGSLFTKIGRGFQEWLDLGLVEGELPTFHGAQAAGCGPVAQAFANGAGRLPPGQGRTRSPRAWRSGRPPTVPTRSIWPAGPAARSPRSPTTRSAPGSGCSPRRPGSSPRPPVASPRRRSPSSPSAGSSGPDDRVVVYITGEGLKTLDAVRDGFAMHEIEPTLDAFAATVAAAEPGGGPRWVAGRAL